MFPDFASEFGRIMTHIQKSIECVDQYDPGDGRPNTFMGIKEVTESSITFLASDASSADDPFVFEYTIPRVWEGPYDEYYCEEVMGATLTHQIYPFEVEF